MLALKQSEVNYSILSGKPHPQPSDLLLPDGKSKGKEKRHRQKLKVVLSLFFHLFFTITKGKKTISLHMYRFSHFSLYLCIYLFSLTLL